MEFNSVFKGLIDAAIPGDRNEIKQKAEMFLEVKDLITEIQRMWNVKAKVISVLRRATGTISKTLRHYLGNITRKHDFEVHHPRCVGSITKNFSFITLTVEHNYISPSSTVGIQLHVSALYVGYLQVVI